MQLNQAALRMETAVESQLRLGDPVLAGLAADLLEVMRPAMKQVLMDVVEMAVQEIGGQLPAQRIDIRLVDGEPELILTADDSKIPPPPPPPPGDEVDAEARITLRLPGYLKDLLADAADGAGDSLNSFVVDTLRSKTYERSSNHSVKRTIDL
ncbi:MAG: hypothetical protein WBZ40_03320 [Acidimicrobiia bacterium]